VLYGVPHWQLRLSRPDRFKLDQSPQPVCLDGSSQRRTATETATVLVAQVLVVFLHWRERATLPGGYILSPSATLRVAGLAQRVKVEHTTV
jgi:hypothetical protein